jgi:uncharacterized repeat protein (TIGR03803 family)
MLRFRSFFSAAQGSRWFKLAVFVLIATVTLLLGAYRPVFAQQPTETVLHSFGAYGDGAEPFAGLVQASDGNYYGVTVYGGKYPGQNGFGAGTLFQITPSGAETVLHNFMDSTSDGGYPQCNLIQASDGNLYGSTASGGAFYPSGGGGGGTVFKSTLAGAESTLYSFSEENAYGAYPYAGVIQCSDGNLYGTTWEGGATTWGAVFKMTTSGAETTLHCFSGLGGDGAAVYAGLIQASDGNLYGTTLEGGAYGDSSTGKGTVFKVTLSGDESVLYNFTGANGDGDYPQGGVIQASDGNFYGTTFFGGAYGAASLGYGTVFKLTPSGKETVLHSFTDANGDGSNPGASLIQASDGNLYGTTLYGGAYGTTVESSVDSYGYGTVFKITLSGDETVVHSFSNADGAVPMSSLIQASDGNLYGTTSQGGSASVGTVFKLAVNLPIQYTLTASSGSNGSIYPSGTVPVIAGSSQMFTATPSSGYQVNQWSLDGTVVQTVTTPCR